ncbi:MAG TPA: ribonuclease III domain-containing protein [Bacilli bacterium]|mgnify:CR=1 FL=1|nr:ribonuclease III domain-containing protein [Bacilli bacterium]
MDKVLNIAYLGDAVYEVYIRNYLLTKDIYNSGELQKASLKFVSAKSQRRHLERLIDNNILTEEELDLIRKGRNAKGTKCKSADIITYHLATGLEYLFGVLYLRKDIERIEKIISYIVSE